MMNFLVWSKLNSNPHTRDRTWQIKTLTKCDLAIEEEDGIVVVVGVYQNNTIISDLLWSVHLS